MKRQIHIVLSISVLFLVGVSTTQAQQIATIAQLRNQIRDFELVASDANSPARVKGLNQSFLMERRGRLRTLLEYQLESLRKYQNSYQSHFSSQERQVVDDSIRSLDIEIEGLELSSNSVAIPISSPEPTFSESSTPSANSTAAFVPQSQVEVLRSEPKNLSETSTAYTTLDLPNAAIFNPKDAQKIIVDAMTPTDGGKPILSVPTEYYHDGKFADDFYCVIHVLRWADPTDTTDASGDAVHAQTVASQNWYVFNNGKGKGIGSQGRWSNEDFTSLNRIFGVKKIWLLYIHLNSVRDIGYQQARYDFNIEKKTPQNVSNLFGVAQLFLTFPASAAKDDFKPARQNVWGGDVVDLNYVPSNITITASIVKSVSSGPVVALDKPKKFDNEGRYWWDVSVAVPVRHISQTQFDTTANTVTAKKVDQQNAFAMLNLYPVPVDIKGNSFTWIPHFIGGVAIAKQPLKKFLLGAGFGPRYANFYVGAIFTEEKKPATLKEGDTATAAQLNADLHKHFKPKFSFGFNLPIRGVLESLKGENK